MNRFVTVVVLLAAIVSGIVFFVNYGKLYRGRRIRRSERKKVRALRWGLSVIVAIDFFISYLAASSGRVLSLVLLILNLVIIIVVLIGIFQSADVQAGILGSIAIPCIICVGITISGLFPKSLAVAFFAIGGVLIGISVFEIYLAVANRSARTRRKSTPSSP